MTQPARFSKPTEGRFMYAMHQITAFLTDFNDIVMMSCAHKHEALIEVELIRASLK